ncbi:hypothetical protein JR334_00520 [Clostridia bacterium]|nr:hypothetical protein JR334_00520 [Clostridia bacterium]
MKYQVKLKTGFFETTNYHLSITSGAIQLTPNNSPTNNSILIIEQDLISIQLSRGRLAKIEIKTKSRTIHGVIDEKQNLGEILQELKKNIKSKYIYEEEQNE